MASSTSSSAGSRSWSRWARVLARRIKRAPCRCRAIVYAGLSYLAFTVISGKHTSQSQRQQDITATAMHHTGGRVLVGLVGLAIVVCGIVMVSEGIRKKFMKYLRTAQMNPRMRRVVRLAGMTGTVARGLVFALTGVLVVIAAITRKASESGGIDKALLTLRGQPFGEFLIFGVYGLCEARWRRV